MIPITPIFQAKNIYDEIATKANADNEKAKEKLQNEYANKTQEQKDAEYTNALNDKANQEAFLAFKEREKGNNFQNEGLENLNYADEGEKDKALNEANAQAPIMLKEDEANLLQAKQPKRYRNTGLAYFDNRENISIADAFLAKLLGVNISLIDMNLNANVKTTDITKFRGDMSKINVGIKDMTDSILDYESADDAGSWSNRMKRWLTDKTGGFIETNEHNGKILANSIRDTYNVADALADGKTTNLDKENAKNMVGNTIKTRDNYFAGMETSIDKVMNKGYEKVKSMEISGVKVPESDYLALDIAKILRDEIKEARINKTPMNERFFKAKEAQRLLYEQGDAAIPQALKLIYSK